MAETSIKSEAKVLIMCGGKGTRMWPISNVGHPKQFEGLLGKKSMFRQTIERALAGFKTENIYISTGSSFVKYVKEQAPEVPVENLILEPEMRDNMGAIAFATATINFRHPDSVMVVLWGADHVVQDDSAFVKAMTAAAQMAAERNNIVFVDAKPTYPSVHNGWMKLGEEVGKVNSFRIYQLIRQVEKPNEEMAKKFFKSGQYSIHTGYMAVKPAVLLDYYHQYAPDTFEVVKKIQASLGTKDFQEVLDREYVRFEKIAVDYGLFEKLPSRSQLDLVAEFGWIDVGTWELLYEGMPKDKNGNVVIGKAHLIETKNSLVVSKDEGVLATIGLTGMVVVDTESGLLVCPLDQAPKVKQLYKELYG